MWRTGISPKMATLPASNSTSDTTAHHESKGSCGSLSAPANTSSCAPLMQTQCLFGGASSMTADSAAFAAQCSETKGQSYRASLSDRLTPLLISAGLVRGITPSSMRLASDQRTPAFAFYEQDGGGVVSRRAACSSSNDNRRADRTNQEAS